MDDEKKLSPKTLAEQAAGRKSLQAHMPAASPQAVPPPPEPKKKKS